MSNTESAKLISITRRLRKTRIQSEKKRIDARKQRLLTYIKRWITLCTSPSDVHITDESALMIYNLYDHIIRTVVGTSVRTFEHTPLYVSDTGRLDKPVSKMNVRYGVYSTLPRLYAPKTQYSAFGNSLNGPPTVIVIRGKRVRR